MRGEERDIEEEERGEGVGGEWCFRRGGKGKNGMGGGCGG